MQAYPLKWPEGWPRTKHPDPSKRFKTTLGRARDELLKEIKLLGGRYPVITTNIKLRRDGLPSASAKMPDDTGIAVYFEYKGEQRCIACDQWSSLVNNMQALKKSVNAIRGLNRWGTTNIMDRALDAFKAMTDQSETWRDVLQCPDCNNLVRAKSQYRMLAMENHPDRGGDKTQFIKIKQAYEQAQEEFS